MFKNYIIAKKNASVAALTVMGNTAALSILRGLLHYHERMMINVKEECNGLTDVHAEALKNRNSMCRRKFSFR